MDKELIVSIIRAGFNLEISNSFSFCDNKIQIELSDGTKVNIVTDYIH